LGHRRRRAEALGPLRTKFLENVASHFDQARAESLAGGFDSDSNLGDMRVSEFMDQFVN
jgi:hypothetical protein